MSPGCAFARAARIAAASPPWAALISAGFVVCLSDGALPAAVFRNAMYRSTRALKSCSAVALWLTLGSPTGVSAFGTVEGGVRCAGSWVTGAAARGTAASVATSRPYRIGRVMSALPCGSFHVRYHD